MRATPHAGLRGWLGAAACVLMLLSSGCAMVKIKQVAPSEYVLLKRGDILDSGHLSALSQESLGVIGLTAAQCGKEPDACRRAVADTDGLQTEQRLSTLAELWMQQALALTPKTKGGEPPPLSDAALDAWLEAARYSYAYLFFSGRTPAERALENRLTQVRDYYNHATQQAASVVFQHARARALDGQDYSRPVQLQQWTITTDLARLQLAGIPRQLVSAAQVGFAGLRSNYRRDGFGAELVAVQAPPLLAVADADASVPVFSEMPAVNITALLQFDGDTLDDVLATHAVRMAAWSPETTASIQLHGQQVPLAGNFTAAYGVWMAQSGFAVESLRTLFGRGQGIREPHIYLMQPYDPNRRIIFLLHGLASSPEAWVNLANEIMGDPEMRRHYQIWSAYYPTNAPIALNRYTIGNAFNQTLDHFDPQRTAPATHDMVFIGHSMGGVIARLMLSESGDALWDGAVKRFDLHGDRLRRVEARLGPLVRFSPQPDVERAIFIASPHRGTDIAGDRLGRLIGKLVRLPLTILGKFEEVFLAMQDAGEPDGGKPKAPRIGTSIDNLKATDPFIRAASELPLAPGLAYHSIIARRKAEGALAGSDDGLVPYWSAHLDGALSEKVVVSGHSVQETPEAVLEVRRILRQDLREQQARGR
ncbi:alpha/beta fold hydrolase [Stenotrophomonas sp. NLF4-10]|uniref:esterase/lipase family protein n=1 Tax=Stenotrophomonas sp. NLF4-10 TaxID=2918754 RepID=UPI001EFBFACD|nr:alpha/beta fold hydrolase [Stenotrophomonas sp. NLF4-10]MCG8276211.1 alpha/beta hydrolase [Stenotrophomonas sp. NLF4-10]